MKMSFPEILIDAKQEDKVYLYETKIGLCIGAFRTIDEAKSHIDEFAEIVLEEYEYMEQHHIRLG